MKHYQEQLDNGLTIIGEHDPEAHSVAMGYFVRTGSRDESIKDNGVSHFLEHMTFKGTERRDADQVSREFDEMGANYNAFTSEEETVYYGHVLAGFQENLQDLLTDMMRPSLRKDDFDLEKKVILEEIAMYWDRPQFRLFEGVREQYYGAHPLGAAILGSPQSIANLSVEQMQKYFSQRYAANNLTLVMAGNFDWQKALADAQTKTASWNTARVPRELPPHHATAKASHIDDDKTQRLHRALMFPGFSAQDSRHLAADVLTKALGDDENSRLYWALVHEGLAEAASLDHSTKDGDGHFQGYLLTSPENAAKAWDIYVDVVQTAQNQGLEEAEVERARRRLATMVMLASETPMGRMRLVGVDHLYLGRYRSARDLLQEFEAVTLEDVNEILSAKPFDTATVVTLGPSAG